MKKNFWPWLLPSLLFLIFLPLSFSLDLAISHLSYQPSLQGKGHFIENTFTNFFYTFGRWPAFILCDGAALIFVLSFFLPGCKKWRQCAFALVLTFVLGAGLLVNGILKAHIERPRPRQIVEFGGNYSFRPAYHPNFVWKQNKTDGKKSFPSGHVTTGAYFLSLVLAAKRIKNFILFHIGFSISLVWTIGLMMARIMQGAHFLSDTLAALLLMWLIALFVDWLTWESKLKKTLST